MKQTIRRFTCALCALCLLLSVTACGNTDETVKVERTVTVQTVGGMPLDGIMVRFYSDEAAEQLVWAGETDKNGQLVFKAPDGVLTAVVENAPTGYDAESTYRVGTTDPVIVLEAKPADASALSSTVFTLGDVMCDFTVEAVGHTGEPTDSSVTQTYTLSELLQDKKAVVLNFWFENCGPCRMEFPFLQEAYEQYADEVAVLAINPLDGTPLSVAAYAADLGLTFPVAAGDSVWAQALSLSAYPTTVVIDRYGMIAMIHKGAITETETFTKIFDHFTAEDYVQHTARNLDDI